MHLTDEQLNEYLDHETGDPELIEAHLALCADCAGRLRTLEALFHEIESLPALDLSPAFSARSAPAPLPRSLTLTVLLQAALAVLAIVAAAPFVLQPVLSYAPELSVPSLVDVFLQLQGLWAAWLDTLSTLSFPDIPEIPLVNGSSLFVMLTVIGVSLLWLVGNGLLLRNQMK